MKRFLAFTLCLAALLLASCKKEPYLTLSGPASVELSADGGSGTISFTGNNDWTASSSDSWVTVSPSSGTASDGPVTVTVRAAANTTFEDRSATVTIRSEGLTQSVTVRQSANLGVVVPTKSYQIASDARTIDVEVQANVDYSVSVSDSWIKQAGTKGLTSKTLTFSVEANGTYDARSATITIKPQSGEAQAISVTQAQKDALLVSKATYSMPYGGGEVEVKVESNVEFEVKSGVDWIEYLDTKALNTSTVRLKVAENKTYKVREGKVTLAQKGGSLTKTVTIVPLPVPSVKLTPTFIDTDNPKVVLRDQSAHGVTSSWLFNNGEVKTGREVSHRFDNCVGFDSVPVTLTSYNALECPTEYKFQIPVNVFTVWFPTAITPGSSDGNDKFTIHTINEYQFFHIYIYNRRGELVYDSDDVHFEWDGTNREREKKKQGAYVYTCRFRKPGTTTLSSVQGTVTLVR